VPSGFTLQDSRRSPVWFGSDDGTPGDIRRERDRPVPKSESQSRCADVLVGMTCEILFRGRTKQRALVAPLAARPSVEEYTKEVCRQRDPRVTT